MSLVNNNHIKLVFIIHLSIKIIFISRGNIMKKILLCCAAGMSTSMVVTKMTASAKEKNIDVEIKAVGLDDFSSNLEHYDCFLLGPQVKYKLIEFEEMASKLNKPVRVINHLDYGMMKGDKILSDAMAMMV
jgi:cellobiose PTS system EIIB component